MKSCKCKIRKVIKIAGFKGIFSASLRQKFTQNEEELLLWPIENSTCSCYCQILVIWALEYEFLSSRSHKLLQSVNLEKKDLMKALCIIVRNFYCFRELVSFINKKNVSFQKCLLRENWLAQSQNFETWSTKHIT